MAVIFFTFIFLYTNKTPIESEYHMTNIIGMGAIYVMVSIQGLLQINTEDQKYDCRLKALNFWNLGIVF